MILGVEIGLTQNREYAIGFGTRLFADSLGDFFLKHSTEKRDVLTVLQGSKNDLTGNIVGKITNDGEVINSMVKERM